MSQQLHGLKRPTGGDFLKFSVNIRVIGQQMTGHIDISHCRRQTPAGLEFAVVECLSLKSREMKDVLNRGNDALEVLQTFVCDQRQVLNLWKNDVMAQVREHLEEKYPHQDMSIVVESFDIKLARDLSRRETLAQNHSHGVRI